MARKIPCQYCKQRRRKCERFYEHDSCERCVKMKKKCIPQDLQYKGESSAEEYDDGDVENQTSNVELDQLYGQIRDLEKQLQSLELDLQQEKALIKKEPRWDIRFVNGELRLETEIRNLEELMMYGRSAIRYLSPFGNTFQTKSLIFERKSLSFVKTAMQLVTIAYDISNPDSVSSPKAISRRFAIGVPAFLKPQSLVRRLIYNYFSCFNDTVPILHEPTFMNHVWSLDNPMEDPVVLAVCTSAAIVTCKHNFLNSFEKRYFSEYFYEQSINKLVDMFDDPDKALESVLIINLMLPFMMQTLRVSEAHKWVSMALLLCKNLQTENPGCTKGGPGLPRMTRIKYALIHRNSVLCECAMAMIDFVKCDKRNEIEPNNVQFDILPDETRKTKNIIKMFNQILGLSLHPSFIAVVTQARQLAAGDVAELSFEEIIRYEETVVEWWHNLPEELKMCTEPFNLTKEAVERETDVRKILMASYVHTITLSIQGCLIRPKPQRNVENVYNIIKDRALYLAMHSADMSLLLMKQIEKIDSFCYSPSKLLVRSIDSLMGLLQVPDDAMAKMAQQKLSEYMHALTKQVLPDHQVPPSASPYGMITVAPKGSIPPVTELYKNFPLPGEALVFDVVRTTVERNAKLLASDI
ncbi:RPA43_OB domain-containing protein [Mucor velutinosus]|uniref:RPA43_OB domain-containing protein n=1 Tax=Mucor velutinosus TaxID=708070 RepID=A0AAN7DFR3_9FUNG|nr:RPA43_OB domain-containing protein [Mucor velutinosus]